MKKILIAILFLGLICTCVEPPSPEKTYPTELIGVWKSDENQENNSWYYQYYPNGKSVGIGITYGKLFAYEAQWWVNKDFIYERVTNMLHTGDFEPE